VKYHSVLIFRRATDANMEAEAPVAAAPAPIHEPAPEPVLNAPSEPDPDLHDEPALTRPETETPSDEGFMIHDTQPERRDD